MESSRIHETASRAQSVFIVRLRGEIDLVDRDRLADAFPVANSEAWL